jgi:transcriptional regulator with XRE-family HTH domain
MITKTNKIETYMSHTIDNLLDAITPLEQFKVESKMLIAAKIADAMKVKGWNNSQLLAAVSKANPSVITKWLSGTHNFTVDTLVELEHALGIKLLDLEDKGHEIVRIFCINVSQKVEANSILNSIPEKQSVLFDSYGYSTKKEKSNKSA